MKKVSALILLLLFSLCSLFAISAEMILNASEEALLRMAEARGLDTQRGTEEIRESIFEYEGIKSESVEIEKKEEKQSYTLEIINADTLVTHEDSVVLEGNVIVSFSSEDDSTKTISSSSMILDTKLKRITALGEALYKDSDTDAPIQEISADVFTLLWEEGDLLITEGTTQTERKNADNKTVSFYTSGETLSYLSEGAMVYDKGYITSNPDHAYSSISASRIAILPGEDMFLSSATFRIGRVPIFYLPFFFYPGSRILGNPSFGFSSSKGAFLNTTFEIFGSYPNIEEMDESSSFSAILKSTEDQRGLSPNGFYYGEKKEESAFSRWVESSKSYLALLGDTYSGSGEAVLPKGGVHLAIDGSLSFLDGKLKISFLDAIAYSSPIKDDERLRYYGKNSLEFSAFGFTVKGSYPFYSDEYVLRDFANRLTGFSISPFLGEETVFPSSSSSVTSFSRFLDASWRLPSEYSSFFLSSLNLRNLTFRENYKLSSASDSFERTDVTLPSLSLSLSGKLLDLKAKNKEEKASEEESKKEEIENESEKDPLLKDRYSFSTVTKRNVNNSLEKSSLSLDWSLTGDYEREKEYDREKVSESYLSSSVSGKISINANAGSVIALNNVLTPYYSYKDDEEYGKSLYSRTKKVDSSLSNNFSLSSSVLGLSYKLNIKLWTMQERVKEKEYLDGENIKDEEREENTFSWDKTYVRNHEVSLSRSFDTSFGSFTGKVSYVLPPLSGSVLPSLSWSYNEWSSSFSILFSEKDDEYSKDRLSLRASYSAKNFSSSLEGKYSFRTAESLNPGRALNLISLTLIKSTDGRLSLEERIDYSPESENGVKNHFNAIRTTFKAYGTNLMVLYSSLDSGDVDLERIQLTSNVKSGDIQTWKGRIYLSFNLKTSLNYYHRDKNRSSFTIEPSLIFSIAEFLDFKLSFKSENNRLGSYFNGDEFSFKSMWEDLVRSLDFVGDGRKNTSFILRSVSLEIVHEMEDWNLNCKYSTDLVKSSLGGGKNIYTLQPSLSVFLSWKTMPDLKVEENWKQVIGADGRTEWEKQ